MKFSEKLKLMRHQANLTQEELARRLGLAKRTVEGYESGRYYPRSREVYARLAEIFGTDERYFANEDDENQTASEKAKELVQSAQLLYAGGELSDEDKQALFHALMDAYEIALAKKAKRNARTKKPAQES